MCETHLAEYISECGDGGINEDVFGYFQNRFWVIDGATSKTKKRYYNDTSDARYLVNKFSAELNKTSFLNQRLNNKELMSVAMENVRKRVPKVDFTKEEISFKPSFAIAILFATKSHVFIDILSDCYVLVKNKEGIRTYTDHRIEVIKSLTKKMKDYVYRNNLSDEIAERLIKEQKINNRKLMNKNNGYWVGTTDGIAFSNTASFELERESPIEIIICTDGFYKMVKYHLIDTNELFCSTKSFKTLVEQLRIYERNHKEIGSKTSDDATAIKLIL